MGGDVLGVLKVESTFFTRCGICMKTKQDKEIQVIASEYFFGGGVGNDLCRAEP